LEAKLVLLLESAKITDKWLLYFAWLIRSDCEERKINKVQKKKKERERERTIET